MPPSPIWLGLMHAPVKRHSCPIPAQISRHSIMMFWMNIIKVHLTDIYTPGALKIYIWNTLYIDVVDLNNSLHIEYRKEFNGMLNMLSILIWLSKKGFYSSYHFKVMSLKSFLFESCVFYGNFYFIYIWLSILLAVRTMQNPPLSLYVQEVLTHII